MQGETRSKIGRSQITSPDDPGLDALARGLAKQSTELDLHPRWPAEQLAACAESGVYRWFGPGDWGGLGWSEADLLRGYLRLAAACLTTTFIITQFASALRRIIDSENEPLKRRLLPSLLDGSHFTTVGISHLTTSRRHLAEPALRAEETADGFLLDGFSPWVTGAAHAQSVVIGATLPDRRQVLVSLPTDLPGVSVPPPAQLVGLSASCTGEVRCGRVAVGPECLLAGPAENVMAGKIGGKTGGLQTSALALGLATAALAFLTRESEKRAELKAPLDNLRDELNQSRDDLLALAAGEEPCTSERIRARANSLALRATQAALAAAKGTGYVIGHPTGRWCREALFFLVWSCPQPVTAANLCELAGLESL
ncbi:MAG TPA: acyl-CoA dehydrogenase family protein [Pirellulales bacterium]|nr:acyl-CoA dehydrogenase family protein [Pirellulales bacterium]